MINVHSVKKENLKQENAILPLGEREMKEFSLQGEKNVWTSLTT